MSTSTKREGTEQRIISISKEKSPPPPLQQLQQCFSQWGAHVCSCWAPCPPSACWSCCRLARTASLRRPRRPPARSNRGAPHSAALAALADPDVPAVPFSDAACSASACCDPACTDRPSSDSACSVPAGSCPCAVPATHVPSSRPWRLGPAETALGSSSSSHREGASRMASRRRRDCKGRCRQRGKRAIQSRVWGLGLRVEGLGYWA